MEGYNFYMINLNRSYDRRNTMNRLYTNIKRIEAYDGNLLDTYDDIVIQRDPHIWIKKGSNPKTIKYEIGASLSHIKAIKTAYENGDEEAFIVEDDIHNTYQHKWEYSLREIIDKKPLKANCITFHCINYRITQLMLDSHRLFIPYNIKHVIYTNMTYNI